MLELVFIYFVFAFNEGVFSPHLETTFGINSSQIGLIYGGAGMCQAISQGLTGRLLHRGYKMYKLNLIGSVFLLAGLFMISPNWIVYREPLLWVTSVAMLSMMFGLVSFRLIKKVFLKVFSYSSFHLNTYQKQGMKFLTNTFEMIPILTNMGYKEENIFVYISVYMLINTSMSIGIFSGAVANGKLVENFGFNETCMALFLMLLVMFAVARITYAVIHTLNRKTKTDSIANA